MARTIGPKAGNGLTALGASIQSCDRAQLLPFGPDRPGGEELTIDHVIPRSQGGTSTWENCVLACIGCNKHKADRTPHQAGMRLRKVPVRPTWKPIYGARQRRIESWSKFISETYWNVRLEE